MDRAQRAEALRRLVSGDPVYVLERDGQEAQVYSLCFKGYECLGFREQDSDRLIPLADVEGVFF